MSIAFYCVFAAAVLPYLFVAYAKMTPAYLSKGGNKAPRKYAEGLTGPRQRAYWAHQNGFEAFPPFAAAVLISAQLGRMGTTVDLLALGFLLCRSLYGALYIANLDRWRSLAWMGGLLCTMGIAVTAAL